MFAYMGENFQAIEGVIGMFRTIFPNIAIKLYYF
jgi:hypothetical protein